MVKKPGTSASLYRLSRITRDIEVYSSGSPAKIARRTRNKYIGRKVSSRLWRIP